MTDDGTRRRQAAMGSALPAVVGSSVMTGGEAARIPVAKSPTAVRRGELCVPLAKSPVTRGVLVVRVPAAKSLWT